ncbi:MAG: hypothetical protein HY904_21570 [Deltaproteobacteria bacterium]|nr:hypothetical protein [Deltaproteobacteria bacterium]
MSPAGLLLALVVRGVLPLASDDLPAPAADPCRQPVQEGVTAAAAAEAEQACRRTFDRIHLVLVGISLSTLVLAGALGSLGAALAAGAAVSAAGSVLWQPRVLTSGQLTLPRPPGAGARVTTVAWSYSTYELSFVLLVASAFMWVHTLAVVSAATLPLAMHTVLPRQDATGLLRVVLRALAMNAFLAVPVALGGALLLVVPALFSVALLYTPGPGRDLPEGGRRLANFWGPVLLVVALALGAGAVLASGVGADLLFTAESVRLE